MQPIIVVLFCIITGIICCCRGAHELKEYRKTKERLCAIFGWIYLLSSGALLYYGYTIGLSNGY